MTGMAEKTSPNEIFERLTRADVFVLDPGQEAKLLRLAEGLGFRVFLIDAEHARSKPELLAAFADTLSFPEYFGYNWDALDECIRDLGWLERGNFLLAFRRASRLLGLGAKDFVVLVDLLRQAALFWKADGVIFSVVLLGGADLADAVARTVPEGG